MFRKAKEVLKATCHVHRKGPTLTTLERTPGFQLGQFKTPFSLYIKKKTNTQNDALWMTRHNGSCAILLLYCVNVFEGQNACHQLWARHSPERHAIMRYWLRKPVCSFPSWRNHQLIGARNKRAVGLGRQFSPPQRLWMSPDVWAAHVSLTILKVTLTLEKIQNEETS